MKRILSAVVSLSIFNGGCALNYFRVDDPTTLVGLGPKVSDVVKSLRCEIITFLVANRLRQRLFNRTLEELNVAIPDPKKNPNFYKSLMNVNAHDVDKLRSLANIKIDSYQYAALVADFKNVDTTSLTINLDIKSSVSKILSTLGNFHQDHYGPGYSDTRTFQLLQQLNIKQDADLGPRDTITDIPDISLANFADDTTKIYNPQQYQRIDQDFYCFKSLSSIAMRHIRAYGVNKAQLLEAAVNDIQGLLAGEDRWKEYENFDRIYVGLGRTTFGKWLQDVSTETTLNERPIAPANASAILGQLQYQFIFEAKPTVNYKYTLVAIPINPFLPDLTKTLQHSGTFSLFLNTPTAIAINAKVGNACHDKPIGASDTSCIGNKPMDPTASEATLKEILAVLRQQGQ